MSASFPRIILSVAGSVCALYLIVGSCIMLAGGEVPHVLTLLSLPFLVLSFPDTMKAKRLVYFSVLTALLMFVFISNYHIIRELNVASVAVLACIGVTIWTARWARTRVLWSTPFGTSVTS